jgi:hypothetical protein
VTAEALQVEAPASEIQIDPATLRRFGGVAGADRDALIRSFIGWYLREPGVALPARPRHSAHRPARKDQTRHHPLGLVCNHYSTYGLTCDHYDDMRQRAGYRCEICRLPEGEAKRGKLVVDHHSGRGGIEWHIRGLLCDRCNSLMSRIDGHARGSGNRRLEAEARAYAANSWQVPGGDVRCSPHRHLPDALFTCADPCEARIAAATPNADERST